MTSRFKDKYKTGDQLFDWVIVNDKIIYDKYRIPKLEVKCKCGLTKKLVNISDMESGRSKCCKKCSSFIGYKNLSGVFWNNIKRGALGRNLEFNITIEEAYDLLETQNFLCALTKLPITLHRNYSQGFRKEQTASLDRINSNLGYTLDNIQWVNSNINIMKNNYSQEYFIEMCKLVANNNK